MSLEERTGSRRPEETMRVGSWVPGRIDLVWVRDPIREMHWVRVRGSESLGTWTLMTNVWRAGYFLFFKLTRRNKGLFI